MTSKHAAILASIVSAGMLVGIIALSFLHGPHSLVLLLPWLSSVVVAHYAVQQAGEDV